MSNLRRFKNIDSYTRLLLMGVVLISVGNLMVIPLFALHLTQHLNFGAFHVGVLLTILIICQQGTTLLFGLLSDNYGAHKLLLLGLIFRVAGYELIAINQNLYVMAFSSALIGFGGAMFLPACKASLQERAGKMRAEIFALRSMATNLGAAVGPVLGVALFSHFNLAFHFSAAAHIVFFLLLVNLGNEIQRYQYTDKDRDRLLLQLSNVLKDRRLRVFTLTSVGFWFLFSQFTLSIPLFAAGSVGIGSSAALLFTLNAILITLLQVPIISYCSQKSLEDRTLLSIGMFVISLGFLLLSFTPSIVLLISFTVLFSFGEILIVPTLDNTVSSYSSPNSTASYLGFSAMGWAVGGLVGNLLGGTIYEVAERTGYFSTMWLIYAVIGSVTALGFILAARNENLRSQFR